MSRHWPLLVSAAGLAAFALAAMHAGPARSAEPDSPVRWQVWQRDAAGDWRPYVSPRGHVASLNRGPTACSLDLASVTNIAPSGTALICWRIDMAVRR